MKRLFHEVRSAKDKRNVVREALRVIKPGGAFAFQDMFGQKAVYGDIADFIDLLRKEHIVSEIHYIAKIEKEIPLPDFDYYNDYIWPNRFAKCITMTEAREIFNAK